MYIYICIYVYMYISIYIHIHIHMFIYIYIYMCAHIICVYTNYVYVHMQLNFESIHLWATRWQGATIPCVPETA